MPTRRLEGQEDEQAQVLNPATAAGPVNALNERKPGWQPGPQVACRVQPLGAEAAIRMGLTGERERLQVYLYSRPALSTAHRLSLRGQVWQVVRVEPWPSYTLATLEVVR